MDPAAPRAARPGRVSTFFRRLGTFVLLVVMATAAAGGAVLLDRELGPVPPPVADPETVRQLETRLAGLVRAWEGLEHRVDRLEEAPAAPPIPGWEPPAEVELRLALLEVQARLLKAVVEGLAGNRGNATRELEPVERALQRVAGLPGIPPGWRETLGELALQVARAQLDLAAGRLSGLDRLELIWHELNGLGD